jgi:hypothetical protein
MDNSQFFYRAVPYTRKDGAVALVDIFQPENTTPLDEWLGTVVSLADGFHTIQQMLDYLATQYSTPPPNLEKTLRSVIERLVESKIVELSTRVTTLPYYLSAPIEDLDIERAKESVKEEGDVIPSAMLH